MWHCEASLQPCCPPIPGSHTGEELIGEDPLPSSHPSICIHGECDAGRACEHVFVRCDFCGSLRPRWTYPIRGDQQRVACDECRDAIEGDDRETLLNRALFIPVPRTVPDCYAPRFRDAAKRLHAEFWELREGPGERL
jgi:hypothetical protein